MDRGTITNLHFQCFNNNQPLFSERHVYFYNENMALNTDLTHVFA